MRITLIKPNIGRMLLGTYVDEGRMEPLTLGVLAGLTPNHIEVKMYDDRMESVPFDEKTDLAVITVETFTAKRAYQIAQEYKKRDVKVLMGGVHPTLTPEEVSQYADVVVTGDAEYIWNDIMNDLEKGTLKNFYAGIFGEPQRDTMPRRDIYKGKGYLPFSLMQFSRGCKYGCEFCASSVFFKKNQYCRKIESVVNEIKSQKLKMVFFVDDNIISNKELAKELFRALIPLKIKWFSQASIDMTEDLELMELMMRSGCLGNVIGFESLNEKNLISVGKNQNVNESTHFKKQIDIMKDYHMQNWAAFTLGYEYDTLDSIKRTCDFAIKNKFAFAAFNILMPYPNTKFYEIMEKENRLLYDGKWWLHDDYRFNNASFIPKSMTAQELTDAAFEARKAFNSPSSIFKRSLDPKTHMHSLLRYLTYYTYNPLIKKEVFKKQGMIFGSKK